MHDLTDDDRARLEGLLRERETGRDLIVTLRGELREERGLVEALEESKVSAEQILSKKILELGAAQQSSGDQGLREFCEKRIADIDKARREPITVTGYDEATAEIHAYNEVLAALTDSTDDQQED